MDEKLQDNKNDPTSKKSTRFRKRYLFIIIPIALLMVAIVILVPTGIIYFNGMSFVGPDDFTDDLPKDFSHTNTEKYDRNEIKTIIGEDYSKYVARLYTIEYNMEQYLDEKTNLDYELASFSLELSIWRSSSKCEEEFHHTYPIPVTNILTEFGGFIDSKFNVGTSTYIYGLQINDVSSSGGSDKISLQICYIHRSVMVHSTFSASVKNYNVDDLPRLNSAFFDVFETFPEWDSKAETEINEIIESSLS